MRPHNAAGGTPAWLCVWLNSAASASRSGPARTRCAGGAGSRRGGWRRGSPGRRSCCGWGDELSWPSRATSHRNYDGGNPSCRRTFRKDGPLPHLSARSFRPHHGRVFRRVRIGCRGDARGPHTAGTVSRGRSLEKRQLPCPSELRGPAALGPGAERVDGVSLAGTVAPSLNLRCRTSARQAAGFIGPLRRGSSLDSCTPLGRTT